MKWPEYNLSRLVEKFISGGTPNTKVEEYWNGDIPWITGADFNDGEIILGRRYITQEAIKNSATNIVPKGSIVMVTRTGVGKIAIAQEDLAVSQDITGIVLKKDIETNYVIAAIKNKMALLLSVQRGATIKGITRNDIANLALTLPPISEQRRIVEILDQGDRLRKLRAEADKKAERILPALFIKMFGDPATNPMGWKTFNLNSKKLLSIKGGGTPSKNNSAFWNGSIPWVSPKDMKSEIIKDTEDHVTKEAIQQSSTNIVSANSILIVVRSGILAHTVPIALTGCDMTLNQDMKSFTVTDENELNTLFLFGWMKTATSSLIRGCIKFGATVHSIDMSGFGSLKVIKPPIDDQNKFARQFQEIFSLQRNRARSFEIIDQLFNILLHRAFTGDLTASWRQAHMKELLQEMEIQAKALAK